MSDNTHSEMKELEARKRRVYLTALACGVLIFVLSWLTRDPADTFATILYPMFAVLLTALIPMVWSGFLPLDKLEARMVEILTAIIMTRLFWQAHRGEILGGELFGMRGGQYWAVGALIIAAFMMLNLKRALITSSIIVLLSALIATTGLAREIMQDEPVTASLSYILRVHSFLVIILALVSAATAMRERLHHAVSRADILAYEATTDVLTTLPNRRGAREYFEQQIAAAERYGRALSVILIDIDKFKEVNDTYGHDRGDRVLIAVGETLENCVRETDYVARWGGEEFLIIAQHTHKEEVSQLAERVRQGIENHTFKGDIQITISLGVAEWQSGEQIEEVAQRADEALYKAKTKGRNRVEVL